MAEIFMLSRFRMKTFWMKLYWTNNILTFRLCFRQYVERFLSFYETWTRFHRNSWTSLCAKLIVYFSSRKMVEPNSCAQNSGNRQWWTQSAFQIRPLQRMRQIHTSTAGALTTPTEESNPCFYSWGYAKHIVLPVPGVLVIIHNPTRQRASVPE